MDENAGSLVPADEKERIDYLNDLDVLYTPAEERFDRITRLVKHMFDVPITLISFVHKDIVWFKSIHGLCVTESQREVSFCAYAILGRGCFVIEDALKDDRFKKNPYVTGEPFIRFYAGQPVSIDGLNLGALCIMDTRPRRFGSKDQKKLRDFALLVENELQLIQFQDIKEQYRIELEAVKRKLLLDPMTGCWNKEGFHSFLENELSRMSRNNGALGLAMVDVDHFKTINDSFGHLVGDSVLQGVAQRLRISTRTYDYVCRYGGDEFIALFPDSTPEAVMTVTNRILENMHRDFMIQENNPLKVTVSIGASSFAYDKRLTKESIIGQVDGFLYRAKSNGRDQLVYN